APSIVSWGPTNITPEWRIEVPTRPSVTRSFQANAVCTPWLTAAKLTLHGYTPSWPPTTATAAESWSSLVTARAAIGSWARASLIREVEKGIESATNTTTIPAAAHLPRCAQPSRAETRDATSWAIRTTAAPAS